MPLPVDSGDNNHKQDDNNVPGCKRVPSSGDSKENLPMEVDDSLVSEGLHQVKKRKAKGYNLRKSIAWNRAFSTEEGILDESELCFFNGKFNNYRNDHLLSAKKINGSSSNILGSSNLETLEEELLEESDKQNGESGVSSKPLSLAPKKIYHSPASKENIVRGRAYQLGVCPRPPVSKSQTTHVHAKTFPPAPSTSKSRLGLSMSLKDLTADKKQFKVMEKNIASKQSARRTVIDTRSHESSRKATGDAKSCAAQAEAKMQMEKNNPKRIAMGGPVSDEKKQKPTLKTRRGVDAQKASHKIVQCCTHKDEKVIQTSISHSNPGTNNEGSLHGWKANLSSDLHPLGNSQSLEKSQDAVNTRSLANIALMDCPTTLTNHSNIGIPNLQQDIKPSDRKYLPTFCPKPSGLRMPSPAMGFFHQVKSSDALVKAHKSSLVSNVASHVFGPGKANCPAEISKLNHGCTPSEKGIRSVPEFISSPITLMLASTIGEPSTTTVSASPLYQERLKSETSAGVMEEVNSVIDSQVFIKSGTPCGINISSERKPGDSRSVKRNVTDEKDQQESPCGSFKSFTLMNFHSEVNVQNDVSLFARLDDESGCNDGVCNTRNMGAPTSERNQVACIGDRVRGEIIGIDTNHGKHNYEDFTHETPVCSKNVDSDFEFPGTVAQALGSEKQIEADIHRIDKMNQASKDSSFFDLPTDDSCLISGRKKMRSSSDLMPNPYVEENTVVPPTIINSFDSQQCTKSSCAQTTDGNQGQRYGIVKLQDESTPLHTETETIETNCSSSFWKPAETSCMSLPGQLPASEDTFVADNDNFMKSNGEKTFVLNEECVMNLCDVAGKTCLEKGMMTHTQPTPSLLDSSSNFSAEEENAPSLLSSILLESVCEDNITNHLAACDDERHFGIALDVLNDEKYSVETATVATHEGIQVIATYVPKGDPRVIDLTLHHDIKDGPSSEESQEMIIPKNLSKYLKAELICMEHSVNLAPFSEERIAADEGSGETVHKRKTEAVQHSPSDKTLSEPRPWSPVKTFDVVQTNNSSVAANVGSHVFSPGEANCPSEISKVNTGCTPSEKGIRSVPDFVGSPKTLILPSTISESSTTTVSASSLCPEEWKLEIPSRVMEEANNVIDSQVLTKIGTPCDINVLSERRSEDNRSIEINVTDENDRQKHPCGSFKSITLMNFDSELNVPNDARSLLRLDGKGGGNNGDYNTCHVHARTSRSNQATFIGDHVLGEIIGIDTNHVKHNDDYLTHETALCSKCVDSDMEFPGTVAQALAYEKQIEADIHHVDKMNEASKDSSFCELPMDDSCSASERERMRRSSDLMPIENTVVPPTIINSFDSKQCAESLCAQTTDGHQAQRSEIVKLQDESTPLHTATEIAETNSSSSFWKPAATSCVSLHGQLPVSEDTFLADNDNFMKSNGEKTFVLNEECVMNLCNVPGKTCLEEGMMNHTQPTPSLLDSSSNFSAEEENAPSLLGSILLESVCEDNITNHLAACDDERHFGITLDVLNDEKHSVESATVATHEGIQVIATCVPKGDFRVGDLTVQHDIKCGTSSEESQEVIIPKNLLKYSKAELISMKHSLNVAHFSEEWIPALEAAGEVKTSGALVQTNNSSVAANVGSRVFSPGEANCPSEISKVNHGCTPSEKGIRSVPDFVGSSKTLILASTISESSTTTVSASSLCQERWKLEASSRVMEEVNNVIDSQVSMKIGTPCDISVLSDRRPGDNSSAEINVTGEKDRQECPCGSFRSVTLMSFDSELNVRNDAWSLARLDGQSGGNNGDCNTCHVGSPISGVNQVACIGDHVLGEIIGMGTKHVKHNDEYLTYGTPLCSKSDVSDFEFAGNVDQVLGFEKQIEADIHWVHKMNGASKDSSFRHLPMDDSCPVVSERKRMQRNSDLMRNPYVEENIVVLPMVTNSFDSQQCTESLCPQPTDGDQGQLSGIVYLHDESTSLQTETESIVTNCSSSFPKPAVISCVPLVGQSPVSKDACLTDNDNSVEINGEKTFVLDRDCVMNLCNVPSKTCLEEGRMNYTQPTPSLVDSSANLSAEQQNAPSLAGSVFLESVRDNNTTNHLVGFADEIHFAIGLDILDDEKLSVENTTVATHAVQVIATSVPKGDSRMIDSTVQPDTKDGACSEESQEAIDLKNLSEYSKEELISMRRSLNLEPFSEEWIATLEVAGEDVLKRKTGAVQHSPPDKTLSEPGPWSPVKKSQDIGPFDCTKYTRPAGNRD